MVEAIGHQAVADWAAFIKRDLDGFVSVRAIKVVAERCPGLSRGLQCARLRLVRLTLTTHGHLYKCLACALKDGWLFRHRFLSAQDHLDVEWIYLDAMRDDPDGSMAMSPRSAMATGLRVEWCPSFPLCRCQADEPAPGFG